MSTIGSNSLGRPSWLSDWHEDSKCCSWFPSQGNYTRVDVATAYIVGAPYTPNQGPRDVDDWQTGTVPEIVNPYDRVKERCFNGGFEVRAIEQRQLALTVVEETLDCDHVEDQCSYDAEIVNPLDYDRVKERCFYGGYEVTTTDQKKLGSTVSEETLGCDVVEDQCSYDVFDVKQRQTLPISIGETTQGPPNKRKRIKLTAAISNAAKQTESTSSEATASTAVSQFRLIDWTYYCRVILRMDFDTRFHALEMLVRNLDG